MPPIFTSAIFSDGASVLFEIDGPDGRDSDVNEGGEPLTYSLPRFPFDDDEASIEESLADRLLEHLGVSVNEQEFVETLYERQPGGSELKLNNLQLVTNWEGALPERSAAGRRLVWVTFEALGALDLPADLRTALLAAFDLAAGPRFSDGGAVALGRLIVITGPAGAGKSTVGRLLASSLPKAALIRIDYLMDLAVSGSPMPRWEGGELEASCAFELLALRNAAALARNFAGAGYDAVVEGVLERPHELDTLLDESGTQEGYFITLLPARDALERRDRERPDGQQMGERSLELHEIFSFNGELRGLHLDSTALTADETVALLLEHLDEARVR